MNTQKYNGWSNYETWLCNLWFNDFDFTDIMDMFDDCDSNLCYSADQPPAHRNPPARTTPTASRLTEATPGLVGRHYIYP